MAGKKNVAEGAAETFSLELDYIGNLKKSPYTDRWERFVRAHDENGVYVFGAEGKVAKTVGGMSRGESITVTARVGKTADREVGGETETQTRLHNVYLV